MIARNIFLAIWAILTITPAFADVGGGIEGGLANEVGRAVLWLNGEFKTNSGVFVVSGGSQKFSKNITSGNDISERSGFEPELSLRKFSYAGDWIKIGKQPFTLDGVDWNLFDPCPFVVRDLSGSLFHSLDNDRNILGNWGATIKPANWFQVVAFKADPSILPLHSENPYGFEILPEFEFGEVNMEVPYSVGVQGIFDFSWLLAEYVLQHGSANSPSELEVKTETMKIHPLVVEQSSASLSFESDFLFGSVFRFGGTSVWPKDRDGFTVAGAELERIWENLLWSGDNLFIAIGYFDVFDQGENIGDPSIDFRRVVYVGGTSMLRVEYSPHELWVLKFTGAWNEGGQYLSPQIVFLCDFAKISLGYDHVTATEDVTRGIWWQYSKKNSAFINISFEF